MAYYCAAIVISLHTFTQRINIAQTVTYIENNQEHHQEPDLSVSYYACLTILIPQTCSSMIMY